MPLIVMLIFLPIPSMAILDFLGEQAKKTTETLAYADAVGELVGEVSKDTELSDGASSMRKRSENLRREVEGVTDISNSTRSVLSGPDWSSRRLESNIKNTTDYIKRVKRLYGRIAVLGTDGATALNTTEANISLNEVQKNQQTMILQLEDQRLREMEKEADEAKRWNSFSVQQRNIRFQRAESGKHK